MTDTHATDQARAGELTEEWWAGIADDMASDLRRMVRSAVESGQEEHDDISVIASKYEFNIAALLNSLGELVLAEQATALAAARAEGDRLTLETLTLAERIAATDAALADTRAALARCEAEREVFEQHAIKAEQALWAIGLYADANARGASRVHLERIGETAGKAIVLTRKPIAALAGTGEGGEG